MTSEHDPRLDEASLDDPPTVAMPAGRRFGPDLVGRKIGAIRLVGVLGEGGMGKVYLGYDETLERRVAVKCIRSRRAQSREMRARFLREARLLSLLKHPNICQIYDYVEGDGADFLVLELIEGRNLKELIQEGLDPERQLDVAIALAEALAAAHARGVVHRDLKPANVMVTDEGELKILDFGIARAMTGDAVGASDETPPPAGRPHPAFAAADTAGPGDTQPLSSVAEPLKTETGSMVGTPQYMSPEQARSEPATPASDVYSLGLVLQEMMTGKPPYSPHISPALLYTLVAEGKAAEIEDLDADRADVIRSLRALDPNDRPTASEAAEALRAVRDAPARRRVRRLKIAAVAALVVVTAIMTFQAVRIRQEAQEVRRHAQNLEQVLDFMVSIFEVSDPSEARGNSVTAREILDRGALQLSGALENQPLVRARVVDSIGTIYIHLGLFDDADPLLREALAARRRAGDPAALAETLENLAWLAWEQGRYDEALRQVDEALELRRKAFGDDHPKTAESLAQKAGILAETGALDEAERLLQTALATQRAAEDRAQLANSTSLLASVYDQQGRLAEAETHYRRALELLEEEHGGSHPFIIEALNGLAINLEQQGEFDGAEELYLRALEIHRDYYGDDHADLGNLQSNLALVYFRQQELDRAEPLFLEALERQRQILGEGHPQLGNLHGNLGALYEQRGESVRAEASYRKALGIFRDALGPEHPAVAACHGGIGNSLLTRRRFADAEEHFRSSLEIFAAALGEAHPEVARTRDNLAKVYRETGRLDAAEDEARAAYDIAVQVLGSEHHQTAGYLGTLGDVRRLRGDFATAETELETSRRLVAAALGTDDTRYAQAVFRLANLHRDRGDLARAEPAYAEASEVLEDTVGREHPAWVRFLEERADFLRLAGRDEEAKELLGRAERLARSHEMDWAPPG